MNHLDALALRFQALADPIRLRILRLIQSGAPSATDLNQALGMSQPRVAHHLKILVTSGLVLAERDGRFVRYHPPGPGLEKDLFAFAVGAPEPSVAVSTKPRSRPEPRSAKIGTPGAADRTNDEVEAEPERTGDIEDFLL